MKRLYHLILAFVALTGLGTPSIAQEQTNLIDFQQHIQPILQNQCISCHGPEESEGGLRVDDLDGLRGYIEAGDVEASTLWTDYLRTQDPDMLMPPTSGTHSGGLSTADLLFIKTWINEGATGQWQSASDQPAEVKPVAPQSSLAKVWAFQGLFHPAAVHLPIALLAVSSMFVFFSFFNRESCEPVAYHCLWIGALGAVAACVTGWSYAVYEGHGTGFSFDLAKSEIDRHRWLGVFVAVFSVLMVPLARSVRRTPDVNKKVIWMLAGLIILGAVSVTGFQGGELTYGEGHYAKYYKQLFSPEDANKKPTTEPLQEGEAESVTDDMQNDIPKDAPSDSTDSKPESAPTTDAAPTPATAPAQESPPTVEAQATPEPSTTDARPSEPAPETPEPTTPEPTTPEPTTPEPTTPEPTTPEPTTPESPTALTTKF